MKKTNLFLIFIAAFVFLSGCTQMGAGEKKPSNPALDRILRNGELVVGTSGTMPPLNMEAKDGSVIGYEADLAKYIAAGMGVKLRMETMGFSELLPALEAGRVDMVLSGMTITPKRNLKVAFVGPYLASGKCILTKVETLAKADEVDDIDASNRRMAVLKGSTSQGFVEAAVDKATVIPVNTYDEGVRMVRDNKADAMIADYSLCAVSLLRYPDAGFLSVFTLLTYEPLGIALPADNPLMVNWLANFLNGLDGAGRLDELKITWFENASWMNKMK
jgi:polar amino acid transport system substrate-binding protein